MNEKSEASLVDSDPYRFCSRSRVSCVPEHTHCFFHGSKPSPNYLRSYNRIWNKIEKASNKIRIKALLMDYTKESFLLGSFIGRIIFGHWNRHHHDAVNKIITNMSVRNYYEGTDDIMAELKALKPNKGGSLYRRVAFIEKKLEEQHKYDYTNGANG